MSLQRTLPEPPPAPVDLDDDDRLIGRILSRREVLALIGAGGAASAGFEFTSQLFFEDESSRSVYATGVYTQKGAQDRPNSSDQIFNQSGGATLLTVTQGDTYKATFPIAVQLS